MEVTESICTVLSGLAGCPLNYGSSPILLEKRGQGFQGSGARVPGIKGQGSRARIFIHHPLPGSLETRRARDLRCAAPSHAGSSPALRPRKQIAKGEI